MSMRPLVFISFLAIATSHCKTVEAEKSKGKFGGGEHLMIGDEGYRLAMGKTKGEALDKIPRADGDIEFTYGELVALSGDFYGEAAELDNDRKKQGWFDSLNPLSDYNNVRAVIVAFREESLEVDRQQEDPNVEVSDRDLKYISHFGLDYLELAICNTDHFGWHNMKRYVREHGEAIKLAQRAFAAPDRQQKKELMRQAIIRNGFADHFLTDGFASGHIRVPREQGIKSRKVDCDPRSEKSAEAESEVNTQADNGRLIGALVKIKHDHDHTYENYGGLKVINARGDQWKARADGELYKAALVDDSAVRLTAEAVKLSVEELRDAYETGRAPSGVYAATELVPFIDPTEDTLAETFSPELSDFDLQKLMIDPEGSRSDKTFSSAKNSVVGLTPEVVRDYFREIPSLMEQFRQDVAKDIEKDPELTKRLAEGYITGFMKVQ